MDDLIESKSTDPERVRNDSLLREAFVLSHPPPEALPTRIVVEGTSEIKQYISQLAGDHQPYYKATLEETTGSTARGKKLDKLKLVLKLLPSKTYQSILKKQRLLK